jgi:hypothetical protein
MKKYFFILIGLLLLQSCITTRIQREFYEVERYPVEWMDTLCFTTDHFHFHDYGNVWRCAYAEADTFHLHMRDTIVVRRLVSIETYRVKRKKD